MPQASGVFKQLAYKVETTYGTVPAASGAQLLRRVSSDIDLQKDAYSSNEIRTDQQVSDMRHGVRRVEGSIQGELSPATYADFIDAALRRDRTAGLSLTGLSLTIAGSGPSWTINRGSGSWITDGIKVGDVGRLTAGALGAGNLNKNLLVTAVTATDLTVRVLNGSALTTVGVPVASCTFALTGKKTWAPTSGHTDKSFSIEHWFSDVALSEVFSGCQPTQIDLQLPPTGMATIGITMTGKDIITAGTRYFTSPTAATTTGVTAAVNGIVLRDGTPIAVLTGLQITIQSPRTGDAVVGSNTIPTRFPGRIQVTGQATAYFEDASFRDAFVNETEVSLVVVLTTSNAADADFFAVVLPRVKVNGTTKSDGEGGITQTIPFQALLSTSYSSSVLIQDSAA